MKSALFIFVILGVIFSLLVDFSCFVSAKTKNSTEMDSNPCGSPVIIGISWASDIAGSNLSVPCDPLSPADDLDDEVASDVPKLSKLRLNKYYGMLRDKLYAYNQGEALVFQFEPFWQYPKTQATIRGEKWSTEYILSQGFIRWGSAESQALGASHSTERRTFPFELQLIHYGRDFKSYEKAASKLNGVLVTSIMFEEAGDDNPFLEPLAREADKISMNRDNLTMIHGPFDITSLYPNDAVHVEYHGSLGTVEPCAPHALILVFRQPMTVSSKQLERFRAMTKNGKPVQSPYKDENSTEFKSSDKLLQSGLITDVVVMNEEFLPTSNANHFFSHTLSKLSLISVSLFTYRYMIAVTLL